jgi:hypothetical protein
VTTLNEHVLNEAGERQDRLTIGQLVTLIERHDGDSNGPGVTRDRIVAYAEELGGEGGPVNPEKVGTAIDERVAEADSLSGPVGWTGSASLFAVGDGRVSTFPPAWHEAFTEGDATVRDVVEFALRGRGTDSNDSGGAGSDRTADGEQGVPRQVVLNAATLFGGRSWAEAQGELESLRGDGVVVEDLDQHPNPNVRLAADDEAAKHAQE